jgi:hypothetical protein
VCIRSEVLPAVLSGSRRTPRSVTAGTAVTHSGPGEARPGMDSPTWVSGFDSRRRYNKRNRTTERSAPVAQGLCGHTVNSNDNCFVSTCWNSNSKRHASVNDRDDNSNDDNDSAD